MSNRDSRIIKELGLKQIDVARIFDVSDSAISAGFNRRDKHYIDLSKMELIKNFFDEAKNVEASERVNSAIKRHFEWDSEATDPLRVSLEDLQSLDIDEIWVLCPNPTEIDENKSDFFHFINNFLFKNCIIMALVPPGTKYKFVENYFLNRFRTSNDPIQAQIDLCPSEITEIFPSTILIFNPKNDKRFGLTLPSNNAEDGIRMKRADTDRIIGQLIGYGMEEARPNARNKDEVSSVPLIIGLHGTNQSNEPVAMIPGYTMGQRINDLANSSHP